MVQGLTPVTARTAIVLLAVLVSSCAEMYRWPDEPGTHRVPPRADGTPPRDGHYVVKAGDTMYSIAFRHQLDFRDLAVWNDIGPDFMIRPGQVLRLSPGGRNELATESSSIVTFPAERYELDPAPAPRVEPGPTVTPIPAPAPIPAHIPPATRPHTGRWLWPTDGRVVKEFGGAGSASKGIDISGALGQPVVAAAPGKVVYSGSALKGYGELIIIKHDDVFLSAYGYNRRRLVAEGATVAAGQPIAELGLGPEQKPVLHFEIREKGKPVNPAVYLPQF